MKDNDYMSKYDIKMIKCTRATSIDPRLQASAVVGVEVNINGLAIINRVAELALADFKRRVVGQVD